jgi:hypothetical protein
MEVRHTDEVRKIRHANAILVRRNNIDKVSILSKYF